MWWTLKAPPFAGNRHRIAENTVEHMTELIATAARIHTGVRNLAAPFFLVVAACGIPRKLALFFQIFAHDQAHLPLPPPHHTAVVPSTCILEKRSSPYPFFPRTAGTETCAWHRSPTYTTLSRRTTRRWNGSPSRGPRSPWPTRRPLTRATTASSGEAS